MPMNAVLRLPPHSNQVYPCSALDHKHRPGTRGHLYCAICVRTNERFATAISTRNLGTELGRDNRDLLAVRPKNRDCTCAAGEAIAIDAGILAFQRPKQTCAG